MADSRVLSYSFEEIQKKLENEMAEMKIERDQSKKAINTEFFKVLETFAFNVSNLDNILSRHNLDKSVERVLNRMKCQITVQSLRDDRNDKRMIERIDVPNDFYDENRTYKKEEMSNNGYVDQPMVATTYYYERSHDEIKEIFEEEKRELSNYVNSPFFKHSPLISQMKAECDNSPETKQKMQQALKVEQNYQHLQNKLQCVIFLNKLSEIVNDKSWEKQGYGIFGAKKTPKTIKLLRDILNAKYSSEEDINAVLVLTKCIEKSNERIRQEKKRKETTSSLQTILQDLGHSISMPEFGRNKMGEEFAKKLQTKLSPMMQSNSGKDFQMEPVRKKSQ